MHVPFVNRALLNWNKHELNEQCLYRMHGIVMT